VLFLLPDLVNNANSPHLIHMTAKNGSFYPSLKEKTPSI
jgi:hypothetical protein